MMKHLFVIAMSLVLTGCPGTEMPKVDVSLWAGDSDQIGITRAQEKKTIACGDSQFEEFVCLTYDDLKKFYSVMLQCKKWRSDVSVDNTQTFIDKNPEVHENLFKKKAPALEHESKQNF